MGITVAKNEFSMNILFSDMLYGFASFLIVLGGGTSEIVEGFFVKRKALRFFGDASYSIYLIHYPFLSVLVKFLAHTSIMRFIPGTAVFLLMTLLAFSSGILFYVLVEKPLLSKLQGSFA